MRLGECVSSALAGAADQASWISAEAALKPLDPLLRAAAKRRLRRALERARRATTLDEPSHVLRVAALFALDAPLPELDLDDQAAVAGAVSERKLPAVPKQKPWWTIGVLLALAGAVGAGVFLSRWWKPFDPRETAAGEVLGEGLTAFVGAFGNHHDRAARLAAARAKATGSRARRAFGDEGAKRLERVLDAAEKAAQARGDSAVDAKNAFIAAAEGFTKHLKDAGQPFYVDSDVFTYGERVQPALLSSYVEREVELEAGGQRVRALYLWQLGRIGLGGVLGYTRPRTPEALVLLDPIETDLVRWVLPALPPGERVELFDEQSAREEYAPAAELAAGEIVRRHYAPLLDAEVTRVGQILARRRALVEKWRRSLDGQGVTFLVPDRLIPEADYARELEIRITRPNLREWDELHAELLSPALVAAFARLRDRYTLSIERHEAQHRLDFSREFVPLPPLAERLAGVEDPLDLPEGSFPATLRNEFSAYLAQLAQGSDSPLLDLVLMIRLATNRATAGGAHALAAVAALLSVGGELGFDAEAYLAGGIARREIAELLGRVAERPPGSIRDAAVRAYAANFGVPLPNVKRRVVRQATPWRH
jgi:hypothetical protein